MGILGAMMFVRFGLEPLVKSLRTVFKASGAWEKSSEYHFLREVRDHRARIGCRRSGGLPYSRTLTVLSRETELTRPNNACWLIRWEACSACCSGPTCLIFMHGWDHVQA